jgi:hypothetical protein
MPPNLCFQREVGTENIAGLGSADMADISVFQVGNRLQITADVDSEGLAKLHKVLD